MAKNEIKMLLLGAGESGKVRLTTAVSPQPSFLHTSSYPHSPPSSSK